MRIAVNTRFLLKNRLEGIGRFTSESLRIMVKNHPEHEFIFFFDRPYDESFIFEKNVKPVVLFPQARHPFLFYWWFEYSVHQALKKYKADVFLSTDGFCSLKTKVNTLLVVHDISYKHFPEQVSFLIRKYYQHFTPKFIKKAKRLATVSEFSKQDIIKHFGVSPEDIDVTYNGCDDSFQPISLQERDAIRAEFSEGKPYFIYIGSVHPRKNIVRLIQAFDQFKKQSKSDYKLLLAGRIAWQTGEVFTTLEACQHKSDIIFLDYLDKEKLPKVTAAAFALTYVSLLEGFGIPILEAMHCEIPVITSNISSMPEVIGDAGLLVDPRKVESIAAQMLVLYQNKSLPEKLIEKGRIQRQKFSWEATAEKLWHAILKTVEN